MVALHARAIARVLLSVALAGTVTLISAETPAPPRPATPLVHLVAATPETGLGIQLLDYPSDQKSDLGDHEYIVQSTKPGTTITRHVEITNATGTTQFVRIDATAARISSGTFDIDGTSQNLLSTWIHPSESSVDLRNGRHAVIAVTITVPRDAPDAEQYAVIWAEMSDPAVHGGNQVTVVNRVGIRAYINVDSTATSRTAFRIDSVTPGRSSTPPTLVVRVTNTGDVATDLTGTLQLSGRPSRTTRGPFTPERPVSLAPHQHADVTFSLPQGLDKGPWTAHVRLTSGTVFREATATVTFPERATKAGSASSLWEVAALIVMTILIVVTAILLIVLLLLLLRRRRRRRKASAE